MYKYTEICVNFAKPKKRKTKKQFLKKKKKKKRIKNDYKNSKMPNIKVKVLRNQLIVNNNKK